MGIAARSLAHGITVRCCMRLTALRSDHHGRCDRCDRQDEGDSDGEIAGAGRLRETYNHSTLLGLQGSHVGAGSPLDTHQYVQNCDQDHSLKCAGTILLQNSKRPVKIRSVQS